MSDVIDDDTEQAILAFWATDAVSLPSVFSQPPQTGRLKKQPAMPYVQLASELDSRELSGTGGAWHDKRKVTMTAYGLRADVVKGIGYILSLFNLQTHLIYPSGAAFFSWWPLNGGVVEEDDSVKAGQDVWKGVVLARVWSIRAN